MPIQTFNGFPRPVPDSGGGSNIKGIQRGTTTLGSGLTTTTATISSVNTGNSIAEISFNSDSTGVSNSNVLTSAELTNSTTLTFTRNSVVGNISIYWVVTEYFAVKSKQSGNFSTSSATATATISSVNIAKSRLIVTAWTNVGANNLETTIFSYELTNPTTITFKQQGANQKQYYWQVIEFF